MNYCNRTIQCFLYYSMLHPTPLFIAKFVLDLLNREMKSFASKTCKKVSFCSCVCDSSNSALFRIDFFGK